MRQKCLSHNVPQNVLHALVLAEKKLLFVSKLICMYESEPAEASDLGSEGL